MDAKLTADLTGYLNGSLEEKARRELQVTLESDPSTRAELDVLAFIQRAVKDSVPDVPSDIGLERTLALNRGLSARSGENSGGATHESFWVRLRGLGDWISRPRMAYAATAVLVVTQTGVILHLLNERPPDYAETRARVSAPAPVGPFIKLSLRPEAREADIRFLLISLGASIVGGPSQLGDYYLFVEAKRTDWAAQQLRQSPIVDTASVIATLPAAKE